MKEIKSILMSENGMKIVNALFLLSILIRNRGIIFAFYSCWIIYLEPMPLLRCLDGSLTVNLRPCK